MASCHSFHKSTHSITEMKMDDKGPGASSIEKLWSTVVVASARKSTVEHVSQDRRIFLSFKFELLLPFDLQLLDASQSLF